MAGNDSKIELEIGRWTSLRRAYIGLKLFAIGKLSRFLVPEHDRLFKHLRTFCLFVGHGRSGGSLLGALLNAHPNIVMSNELNALRRIAHGLTAAQLYRLIYLVSRRQVQRGSMGGGGYTYAVPDAWQGTHETIHVIGDRKAGASAWEISNNPEIIDAFHSRISLDVRVVHVVRNPFDVIATTFQKTRAKPGEDDREHLQREIRNYCSRCAAVAAVERALGEGNVCHVYQESLIAHPSQELARICRFLGVRAAENYLTACASIVKTTPHQSRWSIDWDADSRDEIHSAMHRFGWLAEYGGKSLERPT